MCGIILFFIAYGCSGLKSNNTQSRKKSLLENAFYEKQFTGVLVVDPKAKDTLVAKNKNTYFTPASTVKIFTLYTGLQLLPKYIPTLKYLKKQDTLYIQGTGDPSWLHPHFRDTTGIRFLNKHHNIALYLDNFDSEKFAPGWAWEDYAYYFSPERGPLPLYGNVVTFKEIDSLAMVPNFFNTNVERVNNKINRALSTNNFYVPKQLNDTLTVPFKTSADLTKVLLQEHLKVKLELTSRFPEGKQEVLYGIPTDSIYKQMLVESDNFLAEQLMLASSSTLSDTLSFKRSRDYILENALSHLSHPPRWVDGSGLSRYNLFTPTSMVSVLDALRKEVSKERLLQLFPIWNAMETTHESPPEKRTDFIRAKSGSMGNIYNLCGFLETKKGKFLVFSFMNNHFRAPTQEVKQRMFNFLKKIHEEN